MVDFIDMYVNLKKNRLPSRFSTPELKTTVLLKYRPNLASHFNETQQRVYKIRNSAKKWYNFKNLLTVWFIF